MSGFSNDHSWLFPGCESPQNQNLVSSRAAIGSPPSVEGRWSSLVRLAKIAPGAVMATRYRAIRAIDRTFLSAAVRYCIFRALSQCGLWRAERKLSGFESLFLSHFRTILKIPEADRFSGFLTSGVWLSTAPTLSEHPALSRAQLAGERLRVCGLGFDRCVCRDYSISNF